MSVFTFMFIYNTTTARNHPGRTPKIDSGNTKYLPTVKLSMHLHNSSNQYLLGCIIFVADMGQVYSKVYLEIYP